MGSSNSCPVQRFVSRHISGKVSCDHHEWTSQFGLEHALVYTARGTEPEICTICYSESECHCMVIFTLYDSTCGKKAVAVNIEFVAVRDGRDERFKFGTIKDKVFGENFVERRQGSIIGPEVLFLSYEMGGRTNELAMHREQGQNSEGYDIVFDSKSLSVPPHNSVRIFCDPLRGLVTYAEPQISQQSGCVVNLQDEPPHEVMKVIKDIRSKMKEDAATTSYHINNNINFINNNGLVQGDHNGCISNT